MPTTSLFKEKQVRRAWNAEQEKWTSAIVDVLAILTDSVDLSAYLRKLKERMKKQGNETVTNCNGLKMAAANGKQHITDVTDTGQLFRLIQSIPSHKAEPFKRWLAKVGYERLEEIENPALAAKRTRILGNKWKPGARPPFSHFISMNILIYVSSRAHRVTGDIRIATAMTPSSPSVDFSGVDFPSRHRLQAFPQFPDFPQFRLHLCHSTPFSQARLLQQHQHLLVHTPPMLLRRLLQSIHQIFRNVPNRHRAHGWKLPESRQNAIILMAS